MFPTSCRSSALGNLSSTARIGGMVSPFAAAADQGMLWLGGALLVAGGAAGLLPETRAARRDLQQPNSLSHICVSLCCRLFRHGVLGTRGQAQEAGEALH